jgi:hypothetical protein
MTIARTTQGFTIHNRRHEPWLVMFFVIAELAMLSSLYQFLSAFAKGYFPFLVVLVALGLLFMQGKGLYSYCRSWHVRTANFDLDRQTLDLEIFTPLGKTRRLIGDRRNVTAVKAFCSGIRTETSAQDRYRYGMLLSLRGEATALKLIESHRELTVITGLVDELSQAWQLPQSPPYCGIADRGNENSASRILHQSPQQLVYRLQYVRAAIGIYLGLGLVAGFFLGLLAISWFTPSPSTPMGVRWFVTVFCLIPTIGLVALLQTVGFAETWTFERHSPYFYLKRHLLLGTRCQQLPTDGITALRLTTAMSLQERSSESYEISMVAPSLQIGQNAAQRSNRTIYASVDLPAAQKFYDTVLSYLPRL